MSYAAAMGALIGKTGWPLEYAMWGISVRAMSLLAAGIAEAFSLEDVI